MVRDGTQLWPIDLHLMFNIEATVDFVNIDFVHTI